ncbi:MAG: hypothetical protein MJ250_09155 [Alphaproteobacteria bacterium]|nr:hypothetical protein [Alphaproteobacteria bacterium]
MEGTLRYSDLKKINVSKIMLDQFKAIVNLIPTVGGFLAQEIQNIENYRDSEFIRKYATFIFELKETTIEERQKFANDIQEKAQDYSGNVLASIVDKMENINKEKILAKISIARMEEKISIEDFFRLSSMLERIPFIDLNELPKYQEDYYDSKGSSEILYSTGALRQSVIDEEGDDKYILSRLGELMVSCGLGVHVSIQNNTKLILASNSATVGGIGTDEIDKRIEDKFNQSIYNRLDSGQSDYDFFRSK